MRCPVCGSSLWNGTACGACGHGRVQNDATVTLPPDQPPILHSTTWQVAEEHIDDIREKLFWTAIVATLILTPSPAIITKVLGKPKAGLEEFITIWVVLCHTLPLTIAAAIDAGILMWYAKHPEYYPKTDNDKRTLWCVLGGVLVASMLLGGWLGIAGMSEWSQNRVSEVSAFHEKIDPSGNYTKFAAQNTGSRLAQNPNAAKVALPIAVAIGAFAAIANYFTLYGPSMFFSSLVVGAFLGWLWAIKVPQLFSDTRR